MRALRVIVAMAAILSLGAGKGKDKRHKEHELEAMAELAEQVGDFDKTLTILDELRKLCAQKGPPCAEKDSAILEQIGWVCLKSKSCAARRPALIDEIQRKAPGLKELLKDLKESLQPDDEEEHADPGDRSGRVDYETPPPGASIDELRAHLAKHPGDLDARMELADALQAADKKEEATKELSIYLESRPKDLEAREQLIDLLVALEKKTAALTEISALLKRRPSAWKIRTLEIELLTEEKRTDERDKAVDALVRDAPSLGIGWAYLADRALEHDDFDEAERALAKAKASTSTDAETLDKIHEVERDIQDTHRQGEQGFVKDVRRYDMEDDLRYGGETE